MCLCILCVSGFVRVVFGSDSCDFLVWEGFCNKNSNSCAMENMNKG